jgi:hypothetical protein
MPPPGPPGERLQCGIRIGPDNMSVGGMTLAQFANSLGYQSLLPQPNAALSCGFPQRTILARQCERASFREFEIGRVVDGQAVSGRQLRQF